MLRISLSPTPGLCVKSACLQDGIYNIPETDEGPAQRSAAPKGLKIFINICYDDNVPPPPEGSEDVIHRAMAGEDIGVEGTPGWFVPVVVSNGREDKDKAGKPSIVFDAVFHTSIKSRVAKDGEFKMFIIELALQRIEDRSSLPLSRQIGMPNIRSKGPLLPRTVLIPATLYPASHPNHSSLDAGKKSKPLIEEVVTPSAAAPTTPKSIMKKKQTAAAPDVLPGPEPELDRTLEIPAWTWSREKDDLQIRIQVPKLTRAAVPTASLDLEPNRLWLNVPGLYSLSIDLSLSDAAIQASAKTAAATVNALQALALKQNPKDFDVDGARSEWRVAEGLLVVFA